jgi:hypothetical protein
VLNICIKQVFDREEIDKIIKNEWVYDRTTDDRCPGKDLLHTFFPYDECKFYGCYLDSIIGLIYVHPDKYGAMAHIQMLPDKTKFGFEFAEKCLTDFLHPSFGRIWAEIPDRYPDVLAFTKKLGFIEFERLSQSHCKKGSFYDATVLYKDE